MKGKPLWVSEDLWGRLDEGVRRGLTQEWVKVLPFVKKKHRCWYRECRKMGDNCDIWGYLCHDHRMFGAHLNVEQMWKDGLFGGVRRGHDASY